MAQDTGQGTTTDTTPPGTSTNPPTTGPPPSTTSGGSTDTGVVDTGLVDSSGEVPPDFPEFCSTIEQDCPRGFKCMPYSDDGGGAWNSTMCVPIVEDPNAPGEPCMVEGNGVSGLDDCDGTSMCWDVDVDTNEGTCVEFCIGTLENPTCRDICDQCNLSGDGSITLCLDGCDPLAQDCGPGSACYPIQDNFVCAPDASPPGTAVGDPCEFINVCPPGLACISAQALPDCQNAVGCCAPMCPVGGADPCPGLLPGTSCVPFFEDPADGPPAGCVSAEPGVCVVEE